jgi:hypothetical protein
MTIKTTVTHNDVEYTAEHAVITSTRLGYEDHGILTFILTCSGAVWGIGVGGWALDTPFKDANGKTIRVPRAEGMMLLLEVMRVVGVESWEDVAGKTVLVLFDGQRAVGIANPSNGETLVLQEFVERAKEQLATLEPK